jgi:hypothetical protein
MLFLCFEVESIKHKEMDGHHTTVAMTNLIVDVPKEILSEYLRYMDIKTSIMFMSACKRTKALDQPNVNEAGIEIAPKASVMKKIIGLGNIIHDYVSVLQSMYTTVMSDVARDNMMANILRKLIYMSVSTETHFVNDGFTLAFGQCRAEYDRLYLYFAEQMAISKGHFNNFLEDAQFEYRGFKIINISDSQRRDLDTFKDLLKGWYFEGEYTTQATIQYGDTCIELHNDGETLVFDIHRHANSSDGQDHNGLVFFQDRVESWSKITEMGRLKEAFEQTKITISDNRLQWPIEQEHAPYVIAELIINLMPDPLFYTGAEAFDIELWNNILEENWLLYEVMKEATDRHGFEEALCRASFQIVDDFTSN